VAKTMRAAVMTALHKIEIQDVPIPRPKAREVLVRIRACGVCGSDVHYYNEGRIGDQVIQGPQVLGHEPSGDVAAVGKSVTRVKVGDRVAVEPAFNCRKCIYCRTGRANLCTDLDFLGMPGLMGSLQEYLPVPEHCVERVPKRISYAEAALLEPVSIAVHTIDLARSWKGKSVALLGAGPVGLSILLCAKAAGAAKIIVSEPIEARRRMAKRLGAKLTLDPDTQDVPAELIKATKGMGVDIAIEAAFESMEVKRQVFGRLEAAMRPEAVLATNTSYLDVNEIASVLADRSRLVGLHFFAPAHIMKLLEIVRGDASSDTALAPSGAHGGGARVGPPQSRRRREGDDRAVRQRPAMIGFLPPRRCEPTRRYRAVQVDALGHSRGGTEESTVPARLRCWIRIPGLARPSSLCYSSADPVEWVLTPALVMGVPCLGGR